MTMFRQFLAQPALTGALAPSSPDLIDALVHHVPRGARTVLELGPGDGAITARLLRHCPRAQVIGIERSARWVGHMRERYRSVTCLHGDASDAMELLGAPGNEQFDAIVSSLPWSFIARPHQLRILNACASLLRPGGCLSTYLYVTGRMLPRGRSFELSMAARFSMQGSRTVLRSMPPALVLHGRVGARGA